MSREAFTFFRSYYESIEEFDKDTQLLLYRAIARYGLDDEVPELSGPAKAVFRAWLPNLDKSNKNRDIQRNRENPGGAPKGNQNARKHPKQPRNNPETTPKQPNINIELKEELKEEDEENNDCNKKNDAVVDLSVEEVVNVDCKVSDDYSDVLNRFFDESNKIIIDRFCRDNQISNHLLHKLAEMVINDWRLTKPKHTDYSEAANHLINAIRKKIKSDKTKYDPRRGVDPTAEEHQDWDSSF